MRGLVGGRGGGGRLVGARGQALGRQEPAQLVLAGFPAQDGLGQGHALGQAGHALGLVRDLAQDQALHDGLKAVQKLS